MDTQRAKELACGIAIRYGMALFSRGHSIYAVYPDGHTVLICGSQVLSNLWVKTVNIMLQSEQSFKTIPAYRIQTPSGIYEASSWWLLLWRWFCGQSLIISSSISISKVE
jgi:hypothetical protein